MSNTIIINGVLINLTKHFTCFKIKRPTKNGYKRTTSTSCAGCSAVFTNDLNTNLYNVVNANAITAVRAAQKNKFV